MTTFFLALYFILVLLNQNVFGDSKFLTILHDSVLVLILCYLRVLEIWRRNSHPCGFAKRTISSSDAPALYPNKNTAVI